MALMNTYLAQVKNLPAILKAIRGAQAPKQFNVRFLLNMGFKSTNDRLIVGVLKGLGFLDDAGTPKQRYFDYLDETQSKAVMGQAIQDAYGDLFNVNVNAFSMSQSEVKAKLKTLTQGSKSDSVLTKMAMTFVALCKEADFKTKLGVKPPADVPKEGEPKEKRDVTLDEAKKLPINLSYVINIELPSVRDQAVYDAIFRSLREHIL